MDRRRGQARFAEAVGLRPNHSGARYYSAKAAVLNAEVDVFEIVQTLTEDDAAEGGADEIFGFEIPKANAVYVVNHIVLENLEPIRQGTANEGDFTEADVDLDLALAYTLRGILRLRDSNGDGLIDGTDVDVADFVLNNDDGSYSLDGVENIPPEDLNNMIDDVNGLLDDGGDLLGDVLGDSGVDVEDLDELINGLGGDLSAFYVNTGEPGNPGIGDNDLDGLVDEECLNGEDDDGDDLVDEDSRLVGCP